MIKQNHDPAEDSFLLRHFYRDWRPTTLGKRLNAALAWLSGHGLTPSNLLTLQVPGRRSGQLRSNILVVTPHDGQRYLVAMLGERSEWVLNVRAANGRAFVKRSRAQPVLLIDVPSGERGPILKAYCNVATNGRRHFPLPPGAPLEEFEAIAPRYPVFRIEPL